MKKSTVKVSVLSLLLGTLLGAFGLAQANVGRTAGTFHVDQYGATTYSIPIFAPRGPHNLEPHIALTYDSQVGSGDLGVGWALSGISVITRCNRTTAQDSSAAPVALTDADAFCLDGARLQLTGGSYYGVAGSTYQTEIANFEQVTAEGTQGNGPASFVVQAPDGTRYEYGNGGGSQVLASGTSTAFEWYLDKVTDAAGNTETFTYLDGQGSAVPETIAWTPASAGSSTYEYTMSFSYGTNTAAGSLYGYVAGTPVSNTELLQSITIAYQGSTVKQYTLSYQPSPTTTRDELTQIEECASTQSNCLAPTTFTYQGPSPGTVTTPTAALYSVTGSLVWHYDFTGDGRDDLAYCNVNSTVQVAFATGSGYGSPINTGIACEPGINSTTLYGDLLGNGKDGILADNGGTWYYYQWNGSSFVGQSTGLAFDNAFQYVLADVTGDGRPALIELNYGAPGQAVTIDVRLNTSSGSTASFSSTNAQWYSFTNRSSPGQGFYVDLLSSSNGQSENVRKLDFNGDGREDLALEYQTITCIMFRNTCHESYSDHVDELISTGTSFTATPIATAATMGFSGVQFLKFNSDACTDYLYGEVISVSGCNGTVPTTVTVPSGTVVGAMDWNGDGRTDLLVDNGGTLGVYESTGTGLSSLISTAIPYTSGATYFGFHPEGGTFDALGVWALESSPASVSYYAHNGTADLLTEIQDGYGNTIKPTYLSLAQAAGSTYTPTSDAVFPYENDTAPLYVVNQITYSDPSNPPSGTYQRTHYYSGAWMNLQGRGFAGFESTGVYDSRNGLYTAQTFDPTFPYTGMRLTETVTEGSAGGTRVSALTNTLTDTVLSNTSGSERYFPYVSASTAEQYGVGGSENGALVSTAASSFAYDDYGTLTSSTQTVTDNDSGSPDNGDTWTTTVANTPEEDTGTWCLGLLTQSQITHTASNGGTTVSQTHDYTPDTTHCDYTQMVTDPGTAEQVTESLGYDSFGNIDSDAVTGEGMAARTTTVNWGTTGQFPMSVTNPSGATTQFNYNFDFGLVSSKTDANGLTTSWAYGDGFGRVTQETRPDGTYTTWGYSLYSGPNVSLRMATTEQAHDTSGNVISTTTDYQDMLDRPLITDATRLDGSMVTVMQRTYDALGRVVSSQEPYVGSPVGAVTDSYDLLNRLTEQQRPISASDSTLATWTYAYNGLTETITDPNGHTRTLSRDPTGWLRRSTDDLGYTITFGRDAAGDQTQVTDSLGHTLWSGSYTYGTGAFLTAETSIDRGSWGYTVDALGERTAWTDPKGQHFSATYDPLGRPLTRAEPDFFTQWTWGNSSSGHNWGKLASVCTATGSKPTECASTGESESWSYDGEGRLSERSISLPSHGTYTYTWQYNASTGFLASLTYPTGGSGKALTLQYGYQYGYLQSITDALDGNTVLWKADAMNPAGQVTEDTLGNGIVTTRAFDAVNHFLTSVESGEGGGTGVQNMSFLYDPVGNVTQRMNGTPSLSEDFYYDGDDRLSYSTLNGTENLGLTYDAMGDITHRTDIANNAAWTYDTTHVHEVTQAGSSADQYAYDANGNETSRAGSTINWTSYNYPSAINDTATGESVAFSYGPDRKAWEETTTEPSGTTQTYRLGSLMDIVTGGSAPGDRDLIYAGNEPVAEDILTPAGDSLYYFETDQEGSLASITNASGAIVVNESFTAYGARRNPSTWSGAPSSSDLAAIAGITSHGYTFRRALGESMGLNDMVGRVQDATLGRFLSADPTAPDSSDPQDFNPYSYTENNPLSYVDPTGFVKQAADCDNSCSGGGSSTNTGNSTSTPPVVTLQTVTVTGTRAPPPVPPPPQANPGFSQILVSPIPLSLIFPIHPGAGSAASSGKVGGKPQKNSQPQKLTQCTNGMSPSRAVNPNAGRNILGGIVGGGLAVGLGAAFIASQFIGVGEVADVGIGVYEGADFIATLLEASDAGGKASVTLVSGLSGGMFGVVGGAAAGTALTAPMCGN